MMPLSTAALKLFLLNKNGSLYDRSNVIMSQQSLSQHREWNILSDRHLIATISQDDTILLVSTRHINYFMSQNVMVRREQSRKWSGSPQGTSRVIMCLSDGVYIPMSKSMAAPEQPSSTRVCSRDRNRGSLLFRQDRQREDGMERSKHLSI